MPARISQYKPGKIDSMTDIPAHLKYSQNHTWAEFQHGGTVKVGMTEHAQNELGEMIYVEFPEIDRSYSGEEECAVLESVKTTSDIYCPLDGVVVDINHDLEENPELINIDPYGDGWLFLIRLNDDKALDVLMNSAEYNEFINIE